MVVPQKTKVLVVDDEPQIREIISEHFEIFGFEVTQAPNGREAWVILQSQPFQIVVSDIHMPNGDGFELLRNIKANNPEIPKVFFISGHIGGNVEDMYDQGVDGIFEKPFDASTLRNSIKKSLVPLNTRWGIPPKAISPSEQVQVKLNNLDGDRKIFQLGRGGFSLSHKSADKLFLEQYISFEINFTSDPHFKIFSGIGQVLWTLETPMHKHQAVGVEILHLKKDSLQDYQNWIQISNSTAFIPKL